MDKALYEAIETVLNNSKPLKVNMSDILPAAKAVAAGTYSDFTIENRVLETLQEFEKEKKIKFPSQKGKKPKWPLHNVLPSYVTAIRTEQAELKKKTQEAIENLRVNTPWEPIRMMAFAGRLKTLKELELAVAVNDYLRNRKAGEEELPHRERALRIFGDEKALDPPYVRTGLFKGRITLADLDCVYRPEPLPFEPLSPVTPGFPESLRPADAPGLSETPNQASTQKTTDVVNTNGKPLLIVENSNTYWSCCKANRILGLFAAVVYGKGSSIRNKEQAVYVLGAIEEQLDSQGIWYFGDLDPAGLWIPEEINRHRKEEGLCPLTPAKPLYRALIQNDRTTGYDEPPRISYSPNFPMEWLGQEIAFPYLEREATCRWPQEGLTACDIINAMK